jgi:hypothetical protein
MNGGALSGRTPSGFPLVIVASRPVGYSPGEAPETGAGGRASGGSGEGERDWPTRDRTTSTLSIGLDRGGRRWAARFRGCDIQTRHRNA